MGEQLIISVGREFGSGGHAIAELLANKFGLPFYDNNLLERIAEEKNISHAGMKKYDEKPRIPLFSRTVRGHSNSLQEHIAHMQFDYLKKMADEGESFVIVGRCSESVLRGVPGLISVFILGDREQKRKRIQELYSLSAKEAGFLMDREDAKRKSYHNSYCKGKWGDSRNYDLSINSSRLGIEKTADVVEGYIKARMEQNLPDSPAVK